MGDATTEEDVQPPLQESQRSIRQPGPPLWEPAGFTPPLGGQAHRRSPLSTAISGTDAAPTNSSSLQGSASYRPIVSVSWASTPSKALSPCHRADRTCVHEYVCEKNIQVYVSIYT